jgi:hypothetical protein
MMSEDNCAYVYEKAELMRCGRSREKHVVGMSHSFVDPDSEIVPTQPAPDTGGEWRYKYEPDLSRTGQYTLYDDRDCPLAEIYDQQVAAQIVSDRNVVPKLVAALKDALFEAEVSTVLWHQSRGFIGIVKDAYDKGLMPPAFVRARAALAAVSREGDERK